MVDSRKPPQQIVRLMMKNGRYRALVVMVGIALVLYLVTVSYEASSNIPLEMPKDPETILKPAQEPVQIRSKYDRYAVALKTGKEVALQRTPVQILTFLSQINNVILIGEAPGVSVGKYKMVDVFTHLYDKYPVDEPRKTMHKRSMHNAKAKTGDREVKPDEASMGWKADAHKNFPGYRELWTRFPDADWFFMLDDDSYVYWDHFERAHASKNPDDVHYIGSSNMFVGCDGVKKFGDGPLFGHGGSGIILSRGAMKKIIPALDTCIPKYRDCWAGDVRLALCLRDLDIFITNEPELHRDPPHSGFSFPDDACGKPITFHHLLVDQIQKLYDHEVAMKESQQEVNYGSIFQDWNSNDSGKMQKGNRAGGDYDHSPADSFEECKKRCRRDSECMSLTFADGVCWQKNKIPGNDKNVVNMSTTYFADRYKCRKQ